jgi:hypothetical protein
VAVSKITDERRASGYPRGMRSPNKNSDLTPIPPPLKPPKPDADLANEQKHFLDLVEKARKSAKQKPKDE